LTNQQKVYANHVQLLSRIVFLLRYRGIWKPYLIIVLAELGISHLFVYCTTHGRFAATHLHDVTDNKSKFVNFIAQIFYLLSYLLPFFCEPFHFKFWLMLIFHSNLQSTLEIIFCIGLQILFGLFILESRFIHYLTLFDSYCLLV